MNKLDRQLLIRWPPMSHVTLFVTSTNIRLEHQKKNWKDTYFAMLFILKYILIIIKMDFPDLDRGREVQVQHDPELNL